MGRRGPLRKLTRDGPLDVSSSWKETLLQEPTQFLSRLAPSPSSVPETQSYAERDGDPSDETGKEHTPTNNVHRNTVCASRGVDLCVSGHRKVTSPSFGHRDLHFECDYPTPSPDPAAPPAPLPCLDS